MSSDNKHSDHLHFTGTDWTYILSLMPEEVQRAFTLARQQTKIRSQKMLKRLELGQISGLDTYDPDSRHGVCISESGLQQLGDLIERCDLESRIRHMGVIQAHKDVANDTVREIDDEQPNVLQ